MNIFKRILGVIIKPWFFALFLMLIMGLYKWIDLPLAETLHNLHLQQSMPWLTLLTHLGIGLVYIGLLTALALVLRYVIRNTLWEQRTWFLWWCVVIPNVVCLVLKIILGRARPELWFDHQLYGFFGLHMSSQYWSFPSGHTSTVMGFVFGCSVLFSRFCGWFIFAGLLIAASRVLLTQHYLSDVLFASYLALVSVGLVSQWKR